MKRRRESKTEEAEHKKSVAPSDHLTHSHFESLEGWINPHTSSTLQLGAGVFHISGFFQRNECSEK